MRIKISNKIQKQFQKKEEGYKINILTFSQELIEKASTLNLSDYRWSRMVKYLGDAIYNKIAV